MSAQPKRRPAAESIPAPMTRLEQLRYAREVVLSEGQAIVALASRIGPELLDAADSIAHGAGCVVVTGIGKAGLIGQKLVATLGSTGNRAHFLHPAEAVHGDLGRIGPEDVVLALSYSGRSEEVVRLLPGFKEHARQLVGITSSRTSPLGLACDLVIELGRLEEACSLGLAPTTSTAAMLAAGDALAMLASRLKGFTAADFARYHPGGSLGAKLARVDELMRRGSQCRIAIETQTVREMLVSSSLGGRRTGAVLLVDKTDRLTGIFTDSDLARLLEAKRDEALDQPVAAVMTRNPRTVTSGTLLRDAVSILAEYRISELPVIDRSGQPLGLLDVTDVVGLVDLPTSIPCPPTGNWPTRSA